MRIPLKRYFGSFTGLESVENPDKTLFRDSHLFLGPLRIGQVQRQQSFSPAASRPMLSLSLPLSPRRGRYIEKCKLWNKRTSHCTRVHRKVRIRPQTHLSMSRSLISISSLSAFNTSLSDLNVPIIAILPLLIIGSASKSRINVLVRHLDVLKYIETPVFPGFPATRCTAALSAGFILSGAGAGNARSEEGPVGRAPRSCVA